MDPLKDALTDLTFRGTQQDAERVMYEIGVMLGERYGAEIQPLLEKMKTAVARGWSPGERHWVTLFFDAENMDHAETLSRERTFINLPPGVPPRKVRFALEGLENQESFLWVLKTLKTFQREFGDKELRESLRLVGEFLKFPEEL